MAWGQSQQVDPKEILGMTPEELGQKLGKIDSIESKLEEFASSQQQTGTQLSTILEKLESAAPKKTPESDPSLDFLSDPATAIDNRLAPYEKQTLDNTIMLQHRTARELYPRDFERWGTEIVKAMSELAPAQQADARVWSAMVRMVRGDHASEIEKDGATGKFAYLEPVSAGLRPDPKNSDNLTPAEREMVKTLAPFGVTPEKYNRGKERLVSSRSARLGRFAEVG
ncbi:MAG: hypothetical protein ACYCOU_03660 [Sulfobacillus sp.]